MAIGSIKTLVEGAMLEGQTATSSFRKNFTGSSTIADYVDGSMAPGNPRPNYYSGTVMRSTLLNGDYGIWSGGDVSPKRKMVTRITVSGSGSVNYPMRVMLCDFLMYYPFVDLDVTGQQDFENTVSLPRYMDGLGVKIFVVAVGSTIGNVEYTMGYRNHLDQDVESMRMRTAQISYVGACINTTFGLTGPGGGGPWVWPVNPSDGVKRLNWISFMDPNGGLGACVLVKPLCNFNMSEQLAPTIMEWPNLKTEMPVIEDGAYLNFICHAANNVAGTAFNGLLETAWA